MYTKGFGYVDNMLSLIKIGEEPLPTPMNIIWLNYTKGEEVFEALKHHFDNSKIYDKWIGKINNFLNFKKYTCVESLQFSGNIRMDSNMRIEVADIDIFEYLCIFHRNTKTRTYYKIWFSNEKKKGYKFNKTFGLYASKIVKIEMEEK